jgi:hypothetical protein
MSLTNIILLACIPLAGLVGYWLGASDQSEPFETEVNVTTEATTQGNSTLNVGDFGIAVDSQKPKKSISNEPEDKSELIERELNAAEQSSLEAAQEKAKEFNYPLSAPDKDHNEERQKFIRNFSDEDEDWQAKTHFTDFLQLHDHAHLIDLHKIICSAEKCQLIGKYEAEHESWGEIVKEMQQQDWWTYWGKSSSTTTRDGVTYFNLFVNKPE